MLNSLHAFWPYNFNNSSTFVILSKTPTDFYIRLIPKDALQLRDRSRQLLNIDKLVFNNHLTDTVCVNYNKIK